MFVVPSQKSYPHSNGWKVVAVSIGSIDHTDDSAQKTETRMAEDTGGDIGAEHSRKMEEADVEIDIPATSNIHGVQNPTPVHADKTTGLLCPWRTTRWSAGIISI